MGPLARIDLAENIERQYLETIKQGAKSLSNFHRENCLVYPMILDKVHSESTAFTEETFGPLIAISSVQNETQAIEFANKTKYGLGACIFSADIEKAEKLALEINAGMVFVNDLVKSDPRFPIGGINNSGYGRELSHFGMHEFMNVKVNRIA
jgi:succinate-semialdehyde dehydrogenase/glutarate-semialdehyde dehydrogenase